MSDTSDNLTEAIEADMIGTLAGCLAEWMDPEAKAYIVSRYSAPDRWTVPGWHSGGRCVARKP